MANLEDKLYAAMQAYTPLVNVLAAATDGAAAIYESLLAQGTSFPAIVYFLVSSPDDYAFTGRLPTSFSRFQFEVWATDPDTARNVEAQLQAFMAQFNAIGISGLVAYPNFFVNHRSQVFTQTQPVLYRRFCDVQVFNNELK